jgi:endonuclease/exonuclease/phosphatase family metal-dependent hydrolase
MKSLLLGALLVLGVSLAAQAQSENAATPRQPQAAPQPALSQLRVATYNVLNLFDGYDNPYKSDESTAPKNRWELAALRATIDALEADVLAVQEVENRGVLEELNAGLRRPFPVVELIEGNDPRGIDVGLLSRFPLVRTISHRMQPLDAELAPERGIARDFVVFELAIGPKQRLLVMPLHLKSKRSASGDPQSNKWRKAEALAIADGIRELRKRGFDMPLVLLGDLNDTRDSEPLAPLFAKLQDACAGLTDEQRWTHEYSGVKSQIDHVLFDGALKVLEASVLHQEDAPSDHSPVQITFGVAADLKRLPDPQRSTRAARGATPRLFDLTDRRTPSLRTALLEEIRVRAWVLGIKSTRSGGHRIVEFGGKDGQKLELFVRGSATARFPGIDGWKGKLLEVVGPLSQYRGRMQIELSRPEQLKVLSK